MTNQILPKDLADAQGLLDELFTQITAQEGTLSGGAKLGVGGNALQALRETRVTFGNPTDKLIKLTPKLFETVGVELEEIYKRQMRKQFDFYYMTLTISMQPKRGAQFRRVECSLDLGPKGAGEPIVQTLFPSGEWREVLSWGGGLNLALNGKLEWGAELDLPEAAKTANLPGHIKANIGNKDALKAFIAMPNFAFRLGRAEIAATGEGNSQCFWRIEKPELQETQTTHLGLVFKVPKDTSSIKLEGLVAAEPDMSWLTANVRNVFEDLSDKLQALLRRKDDERSGPESLPIGDHEKWTITLPA